MNLFENLQTLNEFDKPVKVSNKNYKRTLKEISEIINVVSEKELIPKQCNEIIEDIYYKAIELKNMFIVEYKNKSIDEMKDAIHLAYMNTAFESYVEDFITSHGVSPDSETIFDGLSDKDIEELYNELRNKLINHYGPDYDELNTGVYDAFNLCFDTELESIIVEDSQISESQEIKFVLTARNMWNKDVSERTSFMDEIYDSFEEAQDKCREFQRSLASHMRAGIEKVKFDSNSNLVKLGSYWELFREDFEKKTDDE